MITIGLVKEIHFLSKVFKTKTSVTLALEKYQTSILIEVGDDKLKVTYNHQVIWEESLGDESYFGVESCDAISRIINCINSNTSWDQYKWTEKA